MAAVDTTVTVPLTKSTHTALAHLAAGRNLTVDGLLRVLGEAYVASQAVDARVATRAARTLAPAERVAELIARRALRDGPLTWSEAWRTLSSRDRAGGRALLDEAVQVGCDRGLFSLGGSEPSRIVPITGRLSSVR